MAGENNPNYGGKCVTENHVANINKHLVGTSNWFYGKTHTDEVKLRLSEVRKAESIETKQKRSESYKKYRQSNPEQWCKTYIFTDPSGLEYVVTTGLEKFIKEQGLVYNTISRMLQDSKFFPKKGICVGWKVVKQK
jgi:hypothetical protein